MATKEVKQPVSNVNAAVIVTQTATDGSSGVILNGSEATSGRVMIPILPSSGASSIPSSATSGITIMSYNMLAQHLIRRDKHYP